MGQPQNNFNCYYDTPTAMPEINTERDSFLSIVICDAKQTHVDGWINEWIERQTKICRKVNEYGSLGIRVHTLHAEVLSSFLIIS